MIQWNKFLIREEEKEYDEARRRSANQRAVIYYLVALYIGYMGYSIMNNRLTGDDTMSYPLAILLTSLLVIGAVWIMWYATKRVKNEWKQSSTGVSKKEEE